MKKCYDYKNVRDVREEFESVCFEIVGFDIMIKDDF